ncbi:Poly(A) polymerase central domain-containing protein [Globomyces pollinis-pini]|nr:Poly(A) polymerase central domain-containing protein [Globomyces pollinis-pini]
MNRSASSYLGITPPVSTKLPETFEFLATEKLIHSLNNYNQYESIQEAENRQLVLGKLDLIFKEFVRNVSIKNGLPESLANEVGGKIFTFGSYRLGVHGKGSDIDTLCVAPKHVRREDFLEHMYEALKSRPEVTEITAVAEAYVPIIKLEFSGIPIDLVFAKLAESSVPDDLDLSDDKLLRNLDERCVRSLNGSRVTDDILRLVPKVESFRTALRCIKVWAKARAIYSNVMGFFGGVAWAIVVARVCQMYPNAAAATIVQKFFRIMCDWNWPQPVILKTIEEGPLAVRVWNPKIYPQDKSHRMPVITPAYPCMCSTHNVTASTQAVTTLEFSRAADIATKIMAGQENWNTLFQKNDFFHRYKYYLQVIASTNSAETQTKWAGLVESRLRQLVMKLELTDNLEIAHPFIKGYDKTVVCTTETQKNDAHHGIFQPNMNDTDPTPIDPNDTSTVLEEPVSIWTTTFYVGLGIKAKDSESTEGRKLDITWPTQEFTKLVKSWDQFDESTMGIVIKNIKSTSLPLDLYDESEKQKVIKKRTKTLKNRQSTNEIPPKKRRKPETIPTEPVPETAPSPPPTVSYAQVVQSQER